MRHIRFISSNTPICEVPDRLDELDDFVICDPEGSDPEPMCKECTPLLAAHNKRMYEREAYLSMQIAQKPYPFDGDSRRADLFIGGLALATAFWITFFVVLWAVWLRCG